MNEDKKVFIKTYGCQMNVYDSERIAGALQKSGYAETSEMTEADLVLLNTCHIREKAAEKVYSELGRIQSLKTVKPDLKVGVTGCVAQAEGAEIIKRQPLVDLVVGPQAYHRLPSMLTSLEDGVSIVDTEFPEDDKFNHLPKQNTKNAIAAFLSVQEGCDKFCSFCVVPYTRGAEVSRPVGKILDEAKYLVDNGIQEITLLGQNVNAYHGVDDAGRETSLAELIAELAKINGLRRIRFTTSHPNEMSDELIAAFASEPKLMPYLHLPVQAGSDKILVAMNRKHTAETYLDIISRVRQARPDIAISGDFIVGFPGETEDDFQKTLEICDAVKYAHAFSFKYSARPGTPAENLPQVEETVKAERLERLQAKLWALQQEFMGSLIGKTLPILFERKGKFEGQLSGRSPYLFAASAKAPDAIIGQEASMLITGYSRNTLTGIYES